MCNYPKQVTISKEEYDDLIHAQRFLCCLEGAGVDNWDGYECAQDQMGDE